MAEIERLLDELLCGDDQRAESAALALIHLGENAFNRLLDLVDDENPDTRWWALRSLSGFDRVLVGELLRKALSDPNESVRMCALLGLRDHPTDSAISDLISLLDSNDSLSSRLASDALIHIGQAAVPALMTKYNEAEHLSRLQIVRTLAQIRDERAIPVFFNIVKTGDSTLMEYWADIGLQNLGIGMAFFTPQ